MEYVLSVTFSVVQLLCVVYFLDAFLPRKNEGRIFGGTFALWSAFIIVAINVENSIARSKCFWFQSCFAS